MKYLLVNILLIAHFYGYSQSFENGIILTKAKTKDLFSLRGKVSSVDQKTFKAERFPYKDSLIKENKRYSFFHDKIFFDTIGRVTKKLNYTAQTGELYKFDSSNRLSEFYHLGGADFRLTTEGYKYKWSLQDTVMWGVTYNYLTNNKKDSVVYHTNEKNLIVKIENFYNSNSSPMFYYKYDSIGRIINTKWISSMKFNLLYEWNYTYNSKGKIIKWVKSIKKTELIAEIHILEYNQFGDKISDFENNQKTGYTWEYEYDKNNNWIKSVQKKNGKVDYITIRTINYYK